MEEPDTDRLLEGLLSSDDPCAFALNTGGQRRQLAAYLHQLLVEKGLSRPLVVRQAGINPTFGYQIFTGARGASRNVVLQLAFALGCSLKETNRLLQAASCNELYVKDRRDALVVAAISEGLRLDQADALLYEAGEETISK